MILEGVMQQAWNEPAHRWPDTDNVLLDVVLRDLGTPAVVLTVQTETDARTGRSEAWVEVFEIPELAVGAAVACGLVRAEDFEDCVRRLEGYESLTARADVPNPRPTLRWLTPCPAGQIH